METIVKPAQAAEKRKLFLARFNAPDFPDIMARVINRTQRKIDGLTWMRVASGPTPSGKEAADIFHDVVENALTEDEELGPPEGTSLEDWLWDRTSSDVSNLVRSYENTMRKRLHAAGKDPVYDDGPKTPKDNQTPAHAAESLEVSEYAQKVLERFTTFIADDEKLTALLECLGAGITKRAEIAQYLEVSVSEVTNIGKRMNRRQEEFASKNQDLNLFIDLK